MTAPVLRAYGDVTAEFLTEVLRERGMDRRRRRRRGAGRDRRRRPDGHLRALPPPTSTARCRARRAAWSASSPRRTRPRASSWRRAATGTSSASTSTSRRGSRSAPTLRPRRHRRRRLVHARPRGLRPDGAGRPAAGLHPRAGGCRGPGARRFARAALGRTPSSTRTQCFVDRGNVEPELAGRRAAGGRPRLPRPLRPPRSHPTRWRSTSGSAVGRELVRGPARRALAGAQRLPARQPPVLALPRTSRRWRWSTGRASCAAAPCRTSRS